MRPCAVDLLAAAPARADARICAVIVGLAGEPEHAELFQRWGATLVDASTEARRRERDLPRREAGVDPKRAPGNRRRTRSSRRSTSSGAGEDDVVFIVLIGHGTFDGKVAKFNLPGPDMTPADFAPLLKSFEVAARRLREHGERERAVRRGAGRAGADDRHGDAHGAERFATLFGGYFVDALAGTDADADKNRRSRCSRRSTTRSARSRGLRARRHHADRARAAQRQRRRGHPGSGRRRQAGEGRGGALARQRATAIRCRPTRSCARSTTSARARAADRGAEAAEGQHADPSATRASSRSWRPSSRSRRARSGSWKRNEAAIARLALAHVLALPALAGPPSPLRRSAQAVPRARGAA